MKLSQLTIFLTAATFLSAVSHAETMFDRARDNLADEFRSQYLPIVIDRLQVLDKPKWEIELTADTLINGYADCVISAIKVSQSSVAGEYVHILASGYTPKQIERYFSYLPESERRAEFERLGPPITRCASRIEQELQLIRKADGEFLSWQ